MPGYSYLHLDVFTDHRFSGNQLAVFTEAAGLSPEMMQQIAAEIAFSETAFVFSPEQAKTDFRVRIFTPSRELPMAGHPTIGTTFALAHQRRLLASQTQVTFGLGVGPTAVRLEWSSTGLKFAWMRQENPTFGPILADHAGLAAALGVEERQITNTKLPVQTVSSGVPFLYVPLVSRSVVNAVVLDRPAVVRWLGSGGLPEIPVFMFSLEPGSDDATIFSRMLAPVFGIPEDPATGGASGPLGGYLVQHQAVSQQQAQHLMSLQGVKMGRPSRIHISVETAGGTISSVQVGGQAVVVAEGKLNA